MSAPKRKRGDAAELPGFAGGTGADRAEDAQLGTSNREAYLRKMALDGYVVRLELPELKELVSLMRYSSNNLNQLTRRVHETGRIYDADLEDISRRQDALWDGVHRVLTPAGKAVVTGAYAPALREVPACACGCAGPPSFFLCPYRCTFTNHKR